MTCTCGCRYHVTVFYDVNQMLLQAAKNGANKMFGKDELAAILRFGAEDLFKSSGAGTGGGECTVYVMCALCSVYSGTPVLILIL